MSDQPTRRRRVPLNLRIGESGKAALARIAAARTRATGRTVTVSDVARQALAEYAARHDPDRRTR